jgi:hypothetical protein
MLVRPFRCLTATTLALLLGCGAGSGNPGNPDAGGGGNTTVNGQVLDNLGLGLRGRTLIVGGKSTTTDANGQFTVSGISTPYDLVIIEPAPDKVAVVYKDLTRTDPKVLDIAMCSILIACDVLSPSHSALVGGAVNGGDTFTPSWSLTGVSWGSPDGFVYASSFDNPYTLTVNWSGPATTTGAVRALRWTTDHNGTVTGYYGHGTRTGVSLTADGTVSNADITLSVVQVGISLVTINPPGGHQIFGRGVSLNFADGTTFWVSADVLSDSALSLPLPLGIGATATVVATAFGVDAGTSTTAQLSGVRPGTSGATLSLPAPAMITAPLDGATGVDANTDFAWTPLARGIHILFLNGAGDDPSFVIVSGGTDTRIPNLSAQGLGLPSGRPYNVGLWAVGPYTSIDAFAQTGSFPADGPPFQTSSGLSVTTRGSAVLGATLEGTE